MPVSDMTGDECFYVNFLKLLTSKSRFYNLHDGLACRTVKKPVS
jgi:hypothetical protein